jgi:murein DD-endopeptidase MepM/ murein hydrolase activator NlpD
MVDVSRGGLARLELRQDTAPTVADLAARLRAEGHGPVDEAHLARSLARGDSYLAPCGDGSHACRTLAYAPRPLTKGYARADYGNIMNRAVSGPGPRMRIRASGPTSGSGSNFAAFVPLLVGILQLFLGLSMGGNTGYAGTPGYPGYSSFSGASASPWPGGVYTASTAGRRRSNAGTLLGTHGIPGMDRGLGNPNGLGNPSGQATPTNGRTFFQNLPMRQGSFRVGPNGHFWDCRKSKGRSCGRPHHGNDLHGASGTPVYSVADGTIKQIKHNKGGYGWYIIIQHDATSSTGRRYNTLYGHIHQPQGLNIGDRVRAGQQISSLSPVGVKSPHCHFEVLVDDGSWKGVPVNPDAFADFHPDGERGTNGRYASANPPLGTGLV